jgi:hypothetical protein
MPVEGPAQQEVSDVKAKAMRLATALMLLASVAMTLGAGIRWR